MAQRSSRSSFLSLISTNRSRLFRQGRPPQGGNSAQQNRPRRRSVAPAPQPIANSPTLPVTPSPESPTAQIPLPQSSQSPGASIPQQLQPLKRPSTSVAPPRRRKRKSKRTQKPRPRPRHSSTSSVNPTPARRKRGKSSPQQATAPSTPSSPGVGGRKRRRTSPMVYGARLLILGIGIGVISGTVLSVLSSLGRLDATSQITESSMVPQDQAASQPIQSGGIRTIPLELQLHQEDKVLKNEITNLAQGLSHLNLGLMFVDLNTGAYIDIEGQSSFPSASTIKIPILVAFFQAVDAGEIRLDEMLTMEDQHIAGGSGDMQYQPSGTQYTALETATKMIVISDNTATNMLITRLGGAEALNKKFMDWGLKNTVLRNMLPDLPGANKTSPRDLLSVLSQVNQGGLISMRSRDRMFHIMEQTENNTLLPSGIGSEAIIAHKTGTLNSVLADVGLVDMANGKRYLLAVVVGRRDGNPDAEYLIRNASQLVYQSLRTPEPPAEEEENPEDSAEENNSENSESEATDEFSDPEMDDSNPEFEGEQDWDTETDWEEENWEAEDNWEEAEDNWEEEDNWEDN